MDKAKRIIGLRVSALIEVAIFFAIMMALDIALTGGTRFWHVTPHPYWIIVLLIAAQYGTAEGILAALASSLVLLVGGPTPAQEGGQDLYAYMLMLAKNPIMWLVAAVLIGELQQRHIRERRRLEAELTRSHERENTIAQSYQWVKDLKERLELRIAGQFRSGLVAYQAAKAMESLRPEEVLRGLESIVSAVLNPEKFSIYTSGKDGFDLMLSHGWNEKDQQAKSFPKTSALYKELVATKRPLCAANNEQEAILAGQGILAGPLHDPESGEIVGMLKIEKLGFTDLNLSSVETFGTICEWGGMAMVNANRYQQAKTDTVVNPDHKLMTESYFQRYTQYVRSLAQRLGFDVSLVSVKLANARGLDDTTRIRIARVVAEAVDKTLRNVDLAFDHQDMGGEFSIVLPATNRAGANIVLEKIKNELLGRLRTMGLPADFTFSVQALHEKK